MKTLEKAWGAQPKKRGAPGPQRRDKRKLGTMCHALIAEHMFTPNLDRHTGDDATIETFTREDSARATRSSSRGDQLILDRKRAEWKRHLATIRSTLSEIFL